MLSRSLKT